MIINKYLQWYSNEFLAKIRRETISETDVLYWWDAEPGYFIWKGWVKLFEVLTLPGNTLATSRSMPNGARCSLFMEAFECQKLHPCLSLEGLSPLWSCQGKTGCRNQVSALLEGVSEHKQWSTDDLSVPIHRNALQTIAVCSSRSAWQSIRYRAGEWREVSKLAGNLCLEKWDSYS